MHIYLLINKHVKEFVAKNGFHLPVQHKHLLATLHGLMSCPPFSR